MSETKRTELIGKVVSATNNKTITVLVETYRNHPLYHKRVKYSTNRRQLGWITDKNNLTSKRRSNKRQQIIH